MATISPSPKPSHWLLLLLLWVVFVVAHATFVYFFLYWYISPLDIVMHGGGGALLVVTWYTIARAGLFAALLRRSVLHPLCVLIAAIVIWEIFKYAIGSVVAKDYLLDTVIDVVAGLGGGVAAFSVYRSRTIE